MKIVIIEPLGITPEKLEEAAAAVKARGIAYGTKAGLVGGELFGKIFGSV